MFFKNSFKFFLFSLFLFWACSKIRLDRLEKYNAFPSFIFFVCRFGRFHGPRRWRRSGLPLAAGCRAGREAAGQTTCIISAREVSLSPPLPCAVPACRERNLHTLSAEELSGRWPAARPKVEQAPRLSATRRTLGDPRRWPWQVQRQLVHGAELPALRCGRLWPLGRFYLLITAVRQRGAGRARVGRGFQL